MTLKAGIGVITYNRAGALRQLLPAIMAEGRVVVVADDGSTDETQAVVKNIGVPIVSGRNLGVAHNKNRALKFLYSEGCDIIFLLEDDVQVKQSGWVDFYIRVLQESGDHRISFSVEGDTLQRPRVLHEWPLQVGGMLQSLEHEAGCFVVMTRYAVDTCGGFSPAFKGYGYAHDEHAQRVYRAGLTRNSYLHASQGEEFIGYRNLPTVTPPAERAAQLCHNKKVYQHLVHLGTICPRRMFAEMSV